MIMKMDFILLDNAGDGVSGVLIKQNEKFNETKTAWVLKTLINFSDLNQYLISIQLHTIFNFSNK